jgi:hypothetical protein
MRYTAIYTDQAEQKLADAWMNSPDRSAITIACNSIDEELAEDPETKGDLRFDTVRSLIAGPLGVEFEVVEPDRLVYVLSVWLVPNP